MGDDSIKHRFVLSCVYKWMDKALLDKILRLFYPNIQRVGVIFMVFNSYNPGKSLVSYLYVIANALQNILNTYDRTSDL